MFLASEVLSFQALRPHEPSTNCTSGRSTLGWVNTLRGPNAGDFRPAYLFALVAIKVKILERTVDDRVGLVGPLGLFPATVHTSVQHTKQFHVVAP